MKLSRIGRISLALVVSVAMGLGMTACGGGTIGFMWVLGTQYNQIAGFKIDDFTGNLTQMSLALHLRAGRILCRSWCARADAYVYVVNKGNGRKVATGRQHRRLRGRRRWHPHLPGSPTHSQATHRSGRRPTAPATSSTCWTHQAPDYATTATATSPSSHRRRHRPPAAGAEPADQERPGPAAELLRGRPDPPCCRYGGACLFTLDSGDQTIFPYGIGGERPARLEANSTIPDGNE